MRFSLTASTVTCARFGPEGASPCREAAPFVPKGLCLPRSGSPSRNAAPREPNGRAVSAVGLSADVASCGRKFTRLNVTTIESSPEQEVRRKTPGRSPFPMKLSIQLHNPEHEADAITQALRHTDIHVTIDDGKVALNTETARNPMGFASGTCCA